MVISLIVGAASLAATGATVGKAGCWATTGLGSAALGNSAFIAGHGAYWGLPAAGAWSGAAVSAGHGAYWGLPAASAWSGAAVSGGHGAFWGAPAASAWSAAAVGHGAFMPPYLPY